jgi:outer membrane protein OmpA-like peptidoglycan-associated protein
MNVNPGVFAGAAAATVLLGGVMTTVHDRIDAAHERLERGETVTPEAEPQPSPIARDAEEDYCTPDFKRVLQRVLHACGLLAQGGRGCKPADVQRLANISDEDFNELFTPLRERGGVVMFDNGSEKLDKAAEKLIDEVWEDRRGARYFFVVARASKTGTRAFNQALSHKRANSVKFHIEDEHHEKDLEKKVGLMWLGYDYAQLDTEYCKWNISRPKSRCDKMAINRSAFISWVDCRL